MEFEKLITERYSVRNFKPEHLTCECISKILDADAWIGTLKGRLGLPDHILNTLPEEKDIVGQAFGFEAAHPELFRGSFVGQQHLCHCG